MKLLSFLTACCLTGLSAVRTIADDEPAASPLEQAIQKIPKEELQVPLFNGQDLTGWKGDTQYWSVADGAIRGANTAAVPSSTYLFSDESYRNFRLLLEVKQTRGPGLGTIHSAVGILGEQVTDAGDNAFGFKGPLVLTCGGEWGIWDALRRNRLVPNGRGPQLEKQGDWNLVEILVLGDRIRCAVNGESVFDFTDKPGMLQSSPIALQLHKDSRPQEYQFRGLVLSNNPQDRLVTATPSRSFLQIASVANSRLRDAPRDENSDENDNPFSVLPGFQVEKLFTVPKEDLGSWVNITLDPKGRLLVSDQGNKGLCRVTPPPLGSKEPVRVEQLDLDLSAAQGLLFAFDSLYVSSNGHGNGLHRVKYNAETDEFGTPEKLANYRGWGEHGPHSLRLSPDGKSIYVIAGNHTLPPFDRVASAEPQTMGGIRETILTAHPPEGMYSRIPTNWDEDLATRRIWDPSGHARGVLAPGGWVARIDPDAKHWEIHTVGYRNPFDMAFNADGELLVYDADMEWDIGLPWYRPTRVLHATSGSEFGWRSGTGKWPVYYPDSLPSVVDIGPGSPVGVEFGYHTKYPGRYQQALFCCDWTFGTIYALHFRPDGASYTAKKEEFLSRNALPLTDITTGPDGALYFTVGGRGIQSELYRVSYVGNEATEPVDARHPAGADLRKLRRQIESTHPGMDDNSLPSWKDLAGTQPLPDGSIEAAVAKRNVLVRHLSHPDRHIRYAARVGLEFLPVAEWQSDILNAADPQTLIQGSIALAHQGTREIQKPVLDTLAALDFQALSESQQLDYLRALQLVVIRLGLPDEVQRLALVEKLDPFFPAAADTVSRELIQLLVLLRSPMVVAKAVALLEVPSEETSSDLSALLARNQSYGEAIREILANQPDKRRVFYAYVLRDAREGWTVDLWKKFFDFLELARTWKGAGSYLNFLKIIDDEAYLGLPENERIIIEAGGARKPFQLPELPQPEGPGQDWTLEQVRELAANGLQEGRDFKQGSKMFAATRCILCHRFAGDGGATGPDLTQLAGRFNVEALTEAIMEPSKVISDQYRAHQIITVDGRSLSGRIVSETPDQLTLVTDPEDSTKVVDLKRSDIEEMQPAQLSLMPAGLLKPLNEEEVLDLLAYLLSRGDPDDKMFKKGAGRPKRAAAERKVSSDKKSDSPTAGKSATADKKE